jgi:flagellar basal body rod protein FlgC
MVDLMMASSTFDANVTVVNAAKGMILKSLEI